jgi:hypothetical protein
MRKQSKVKGRYVVTPLEKLIEVLKESGYLEVELPKGFKPMDAHRNLDKQHYALYDLDTNTRILVFGRGEMGFFGHGFEMHFDSKTGILLKHGAFEQ